MQTRLNWLPTPNVSTPDLALLADALATARDKHTLTDVGPFATLASVDQAYELQTLAIERYPSRRSGYKIGATSEAAQKIIGCDGPFLGPVFERDTFDAGSTLELVPGTMGGEAEFAFRVGSDFPTQSDLTADDIVPLIDSCHVAIEIVGRRTAAEGLPGLLMAISDFGANSAFIPGPAIDNWQSMDLSQVAVRASIDGEVSNTGSGAAVLGNPLNALLWLQTQLIARDDTLRAGEWVSTGTCLGVIEARAGATIDVDFDGCGTIRYALQ
jgi:2-keto-4-pentenoate hydratase